MGTPQKPHPVLGAVVPIKNEVNGDESQQPAPRPTWHLKDPKLVQP